MNCFHGLKPALMMVLVQVILAGRNILYKLAIDDGMSKPVLVAYRFLFAASFLAPLAFFVERRIRPSLTRRILFQSFLCGLFGGPLAQNLFLYSMNLTSATFASAMTNLIPAITFIIAVTFGLEKMAIRTLEGKARIMGTVIGIGGAMLFTLYKGVEINLLSGHLIHYANRGSHVVEPTTGTGHRVLGALLAAGSCLSDAAWLLIQSTMSKNYPCQYSSTALMCIMGSIQAGIFALCMERDWNQWKLGWDIRLLTVAYSGILATGLNLTVIAWGVRLRGPLYVSVFTPLTLVIVALAGSIFLEEKLYLGSVLGFVLIFTGLYTFLWGESMKIKKLLMLMPSKSSRVSSEASKVVITTPFDDDNAKNNSVIHFQPKDDLKSLEVRSFHSFGLDLETGDLD